VAGLGVRRASAAAVVLSLVAAPALAAPAGERDDPPKRYRLLSENDRGKVADELSVSPSISGDGRLVAFTSYALNLAPQVRPGRNKQVYLWDRRTSRLELAVRRPNGGLLVDAEAPALSPSGKYLAFCSRDPKLVRPDARASDALFYADEDVFVTNLRTGETRRASSDHRGGMSDGYSCGPRVADTGDVVFHSFATDLVAGDDDEYEADVFLWDWSSERTKRLTREDEGNYTYDLSGDGGTVAVVTTEAHVSADDQEFTDLYLYRRPGSGLRGTWELGLPRADGSAPGVIYDGVDISRDGRFVTGISHDGRIASPPIPDAEETLHLWLRDRRTGRTTWVNAEADPSWGVRDVHVSDDGRTVTYNSGGEVSELYAWRRGRGLSSQTARDDVWTSPSGADLSGDGDWAVFTMLRTDLPGLNPLTEPARVVVYLTRVS
jgi:hypothetical protein